VSDDDLAEFRAARNRYAVGPRGPLALVNAQQVDFAQPVWPVQGEWAPAVGGLTVTADPDMGVLVDDVLVDGSVLVAGDDAVVPSTVVFADGMAGTVVATPTGHALRVWDPTSDAIGRFDRIAVFDRAASWVLSGTYTPIVDSAGLEAVATLVDAAGVPLPVAGHVAVQIDGVEHSVTVVRSAAFQGSERLQLIFQDATGRLPEDDPHSTYSMGRFLFLDDPSEQTTVELDFNRAVLPPCAFSYQFACPIPPPENRLPVEVRAGERHPMSHDGDVLH
jgi:uncharacterized protein